MLQVAIDSCWIGSLNCPLYMFSSSIYDAIAMESVLFIRQNQLVFYFTGNYSVLSPRVPGSGKRSQRWPRPISFPTQRGR